MTDDDMTDPGRKFLLEQWARASHHSDQVILGALLAHDLPRSGQRALADVGVVHATRAASFLVKSASPNMTEEAVRARVAVVVRALLDETGHHDREVAFP